MGRGEILAAYQYLYIFDVFVGLILVAVLLEIY
jgi:hypothetical protein